MPNYARGVVLAAAVSAAGIIFLAGLCAAADRPAAGESVCLGLQADVLRFHQAVETQRFYEWLRDHAGGGIWGQSIGFMILQEKKNVVGLVMDMDDARKRLRGAPCEEDPLNLRGR